MRMDAEWQRFHLATMLTEAKGDGFKVVGATLSQPMERTEIENEFNEYVERNLFPPEGEW